MSTTGLSPVMRAYARLVRAHRDWNLRDASDTVAAHKILNRMASAKNDLIKRHGGMTPQYVHMWASAKAEGEALATATQEAHHATHPTA